MCENCKCVVRDGKRLICMCKTSENHYNYVHKYDVYDKYNHNEE